MIWLKVFGPILAAALVLGGAYKCGSDAKAKDDAKHYGKIIDQKDELILGCQTDLAQANTDLGIKDGLIRDNNTRIENILRDAKARDVANAVALKRAKAEANGFRSEAERIAAMKSGPDQCESTREMFVEILKGERQ